MPKKDKSDEIIEADDHEVEEKFTAPKRGRGRPPKNLGSLSFRENSVVSKKSKENEKKELGTIGVGTFSIDKDTVRGPLTDFHFKTSKRTVSCKKCENCRKNDCNKCIYCLDRKKNGGKGNLKKICVERRCSNPQMSGFPALSTYRTKTVIGGNEPKRNYLRVATAVATKSAPPPPQEFDESLPSEPRSPTENNAEVQSVGYKSRPNMSFAALIALALDNLPQQKGTLHHIYQYLMDRFPYFRKDEVKPQWQNSIRHNLSLQKKWFVKGEKSSKGGSYWSIHPEADKDVLLKKKKNRITEEDVERDKELGIVHEEQNPITPSTFISQTSTIPTQEVPKSKQISATKSACFNQTLEDFLGLSDQNTITLEDCLEISSTAAPTFEFAKKAPQLKSPEKVKILDHNKSNSLSSNDLVHVPTPPIGGNIKMAKKSNPLVAFAAKSTPKLKTTASVGTMDYWEQYDPEEVVHSGQAVITTENLPFELSCFLCGAAGEEQMINCSNCCESFHEFCVQDLHPQLTKEKITWSCQRCALCHICGSNSILTNRRCNKCGKAFHEGCIQPSQGNVIQEGVAWVRQRVEDQ